MIIILIASTSRLLNNIFLQIFKNHTLKLSYIRFFFIFHFKEKVKVILHILMIKNEVEEKKERKKERMRCKMYFKSDSSK